MLEKLKLYIAYKNLYSAFAYRSRRTSRGAQVFERFGCAMDSERKFKAKNRIRTVISYHMLSTLLNLFKLVYGPFGQ